MKISGVFIDVEWVYAVLFSKEHNHGISSFDWCYLLCADLL